MLTLEKLKEIDKYAMFKIYEKWPEIAKESYQKEVSKLDIKDIDHIVFAGMGGSGTISDIFSSILSKTNIHVSIVKGYLLPKTVDKNTLVICTSVSGNTKETLSILENYKNSQAKFVSFSSGGMMEEFCKKNTIKHYKIEKIHSPRASFLSFLYSTLNVLEEIIPINKSEIKESIDFLNQTKNKIDSKNQSILLSQIY